MRLQDRVHGGEAGVRYTPQLHEGRLRTLSNLQES